MNAEGVSQESFFQGSSKRKSTYIVIVASISITTAVVLLIVSGILYGYTGGNIPFDNGIVIDAGSTHTEVILYKWLGSKDHETGDVIQETSCTYEGGIESLTDPTVIVTCVNNLTQSLTKGVQQSTSTYLGATAGMRLLKLNEPKLTDMILLALQYALKSTGLDVKTVDIITGNDEGIFSWISVNYLLKGFSKNSFLWPINKKMHSSENTLGALDMGGASTQIAFAINHGSYINTSLTNIKLYGHSYKVLSESYLCFGLMQAFYRHQSLLIKDLNTTSNIIDPCLPKGNFSKSVAGILLRGPCTQNPNFENWLDIKNHSNKVFTFEGSSDFKKCAESIDYVLDKAHCEEIGFKMCPPIFNISITSMNFVAFSSFYHMTRFLNSTNASLPEFISNIENWCKMPWEEIMKHTYVKSDLSHLTQYCFGAYYVVKWLTNIYGFTEYSWSNITFQQQIDGSDVGWALGYMINATNIIPEELPAPPVLSTVVFVLFVVFGIVIMIIGLLLLRKYFKTGYQYSHLKHERLLEA